MAKCPRCKSYNTSCLNWLEVIGSNVAGGVAGGIAGIFNPSMSTPVHIKVSRNIVSSKKYVCNECGAEFVKDRTSGDVYVTKHK